MLKKSSQQSYEVRFSYFTKSPLQNVKMSEFKAQTIYTWIKWLKKQKTVQNKGRQTFIKELGFLKIILYWYSNFVDEDFNVPLTKKT